MKPLGLLFIGLLLAGAARAQQLRGSFYRVAKERGFTADLFQFSGNRFYYLQSGCTGSTEGRGTFSVRDNSLLLYCEKIAGDTAVTSAALTDTAAVPTFHFQVLEKQTKGAVPGADITSVGQHTGVSTNTAGEADFTYLPPAGDKLSIRAIGYNEVVVPIRGSASQRITIRMGQPYYFKAGDTLVFQLKDIRPDSFAYRHLLATVETEDNTLPYAHCQRISATAARKVRPAE